jgi:hypothetical protein
LRSDYLRGRLHHTERHRWPRWRQHQLSTNIPPGLSNERWPSEQEANGEMKSHNFVLVRGSLTLLAMVAVVSIACLGLCGIAISPAFSKEKGELQELIVTHGATHFVAVNGSDNGPGTADRPWATINHAADQAEAGDMVVVRGGRYVLAAQVRPHNSGRPDAWLTFMGYPGEEPIFDAQMVQRSSSASGDFIHKAFQTGAFQIEGVSYVRVANLTVINSHDAGFNVRDSSNIDLINNSTKGTFSSGIAVWDTNHDGKGTQHIRIIGNTITRATTWDLAPPDVPRRGSPPQEALSIGGAVDFEVAFNHIYDSDKEGIDIKETSKRGKVHHNLVDNIAWQGIYVDAWFGEINDIEIFSNVIHDCRAAGLVLSVENGRSVENVRIHNNLIFNNYGSGLFFSRYDADNARRNIQISNNVFYHNGYGPPNAGQTYYWLTGGLYLYSTNVHGVSIRNNIFSDNRGFQIGYSELFIRDGRSWQTVTREKKIQINGNLIDGRNTINSPVKSGGAPPDRVNIYAVNGDRAIFGNPLFKNPANQDFTLRRGSPAVVGHVVAGAYSPGSRSQLWWKRDFPPRLVRSRFDRAE